LYNRPRVSHFVCMQSGLHILTFLWGPTRCRCPKPLKVVRFDEDSLSLNQLNISRADIACILESDVGEAARSTQPVTLYIRVNITPPNLYNSSSSIPTNVDGSPAEGATIPERILFPVPEHSIFPLSHHQPAESGNTWPQSQEKMSPTTNTKDPQFDLLRANEAIEQIVPTGRSKSWKKAVGRIKWMWMRWSQSRKCAQYPFDALGWAKLHT
jgi:hypothetical protein